MSQCVHLLTSTPISLPTDLWVPITEDIKPEIAQQYSVGAYYTGFKMWELSLEGYYKTLDNVLEHKDGMSFMGFSSNWQDLVAMGKGTYHNAPPKNADNKFCNVVGVFIGYNYNLNQ